MTELKLEPCIELSVSEKELNRIIQKAKDWAIMHGELLNYFFIEKNL